MAISGSFNYSFTTQRENDYREGTLSTGYTGITYLRLTVSYGWSSPSNSVSQTIQIRNPSGTAVASNSGSGTSGTFTVTATNLNPSLSYSIWGSASSYLGATFAIVQGYGTISYTGLNPAVINTFIASPNPQNSIINGVPAYNTTLSWTTTDATTLTLTSSASESWDVSGTSNKNITNLPQSVVGTNSPATRSYTLTASNAAGSNTNTITVESRNDNSPTGLSIPSTTIGGVSLNSLEPSTQYTIYLGAAGGIDMSTLVNCTTSGLEASSNQSSWSNIIYVTNTQGVYLRFTSQPFNTDPSGLTNSKSYSFSVGTYSNTFTAITRAPNVNEIFDFGDSIANYPNPDIDVIANTPTTYIQSPTTLVVDNVEVPVEIKVGQADAEIRIKTQGNSTFGSWQSARQV